jgi:hypothetical protein
MFISLPENFKIVQAIAPVSSTAATTGDYVSMKNVKHAWVVVQATGGDAVYATMYEATNTTGGSAAATTSIAYDIWSNSSTTGDTLTKRTSSYRYATTTDATNQMIVFGLDPSQLTDGYDCIQVRFGASTGTTPTVAATYYLQTAYPADQPPTAIAD